MHEAGMMMSGRWHWVLGRQYRDVRERGWDGDIRAKTSV